MSSAGMMLRRAHAVLLHIAEGSGATTLRRIAADLDMPQSTAHRVLKQLIDDGLVVVDEDGQYRLGWQALQLARRIWNGASDEALALPLMRELSDATGESVTLNKYLPQEGICVCVAVAETRHLLSYALAVGDTRHLNMGAGGKSILAGLPEVTAEAIITTHGLPAATDETVTEADALRRDVAKIREQGYARSSGESVTGAIGYAVPVFQRGDRVFGSMAVTAPQMRFRPEWEGLWISKLVGTARTLSELFGAPSQIVDGFFAPVEAEGVPT